MTTGLKTLRNERKMTTGLKTLTRTKKERKMTTGLKTLPRTKKGEEDDYRAEDTNTY